MQDIIGNRGILLVMLGTRTQVVGRVMLRVAKSNGTLKSNGSPMLAQDSKKKIGVLRIALIT
jgi:hypothetical protein